MSVGNVQTELLGPLGGIEELRDVDHRLGWIATIVEAGATDLIALYHSDSRSFLGGGRRGCTASRSCSNYNQIISLLGHMLLLCSHRSDLCLLKRFFQKFEDTHLLRAQSFG